MEGGIQPHISQPLSEDLTTGAVLNSVLWSHVLFLKTFVLAASGLEVRMQDWQAGFVVSILSLSTVLSHKGER